MRTYFMPFNFSAHEISKIDKMEAANILIVSIICSKYFRLVSWFHELKN